MKTTTQILILPALAASLATQAFAIEAPEDNAPPPPAAPEAGRADARAEAPEADLKPADKQQTAYLGVVTSDLPAMLSEHLALKPGEGIIVRSVMPDGPAANAGIAVNDVITMVDGKAVGSSTDLTREITGHKPGDKVALDLIQKGKASKVEVALGNRPDEFAGIQARPLDELNLDGVPKDLAERIRGMIEGNIGAMGLQLDGDAGFAPAPQMEDAMRQMKERMEKAMGGIQIPGELQAQGRIDVQQGATIRMMDDQGSVEVKSNDGSKEVTIRDKGNNITWTGPWDTEQDKAAAPEDVRSRVERLNFDTKFKGNGLRLQMRPMPAPAPEEAPE